MTIFVFSQAVPIPSSQKDEVKETFVGLALCQNIELAEIPKHSVLKQVSDTSVEVSRDSLGFSYTQVI